VSRGDASDSAYVQQLGAVLRARDAVALRAFLVANAERFGDAEQVASITAQSDEEITTLLHRMTLARADLAQHHAESRQWLAEHGLRGPSSDPERQN
jgi:hypothetical protein